VNIVSLAGGAEGQRKRKSRWGSAAEKSFVPGMPTMLPSNLTEEQRQIYLRKTLQ